jgi:hypothetical protein
VLQAQGESLIRKALTELQLWGLQRSFTFLSTPDAKAPTSSTGAAAAGPGGSSMQGSRAVPLIKDWAGVLSEVGDHQSLVASLKASPYYDMLKVRQHMRTIGIGNVTAQLVGVVGLSSLLLTYRLQMVGNCQVCWELSGMSMPAKTPLPRHWCVHR